ncbi:MAG: helix-turn-helix domain-containing protein [Candidatus Acidiferrales bacterium]
MSHKKIVATGSPTLPASTETLLTVPELAALLRLSTSAIRAWVLYKRIPYIKLGGKSIRFRRSDVEALLQRSTVRSKHGAA